MQRPRLISPLSLAGFFCALAVVLVLLYPHRQLYEQIERDTKVDEVSIQYLLNLLALEPDNEELRLHLARSYISLGQYDKAFAVLQRVILQDDAQWREQAILLKLDILLKVAFAEKTGSAERLRKIALFDKAMHESEIQIVSAQGMREFARLAELGGSLQMAKAVFNRLLQHEENLFDLDEAARIALANGEYLESAKFTWRSRQLATDSEKKISYLKLAMSTLQAGGLGNIGLEWVLNLPEKEWQRVDVLLVLTRLAQASNRPALATMFARKLVAVDSPAYAAEHFVVAHSELAYSAFMGSQDLELALQLAQIAVKVLPVNVRWHERLAQVAEWSGHPQIAIDEWRWLALHQNDESYWKSWMRLAGALFDYKAQIAGLEHEWQSHGRDEKYARKIVNLYEKLGQPEDSVAWLDKNGNETNHPELLLISAEILNGMGQERQAIQRYRRYLGRNAASPELAVTIAVLLQRNGLYQEAFELLVRVRPQAKPEHRLFWVNLGELAWMLKKYDEANIAYRILSDAPDAELNHQMRLVQVVKINNPRMAAKTAETYWLKTGHIELFMSAADGYAALKDWKALQKLYQLADVPKWQDYENNLRFVSVRAEMYKNTGNYLAAERDYRSLALRYPGDMGIKESYLWMLIDAHHFNELDVFMQRWEKLLPTAPNLWDVFAAGHLALSRPAKAVILYDQMLKSHAQNDLWLINYAATLESVGQVTRAGKIRNQIWQHRKNNSSSRDWLNTASNLQDIEALRLLLLNDPAMGQGVLWKLLKAGSAALRQNPQFVELATAWLNDHDQNDASRAWLIRQYARRLNTTQ